MDKSATIPESGEVTAARAAAREEHARRAASFGAAATAYAEHRPDYAVAAIEWAIEPAVRLGRRPVRILDLGAGTGKLTAQLGGLDVGGGPAAAGGVLAGGGGGAAGDPAAGAGGVAAGTGGRAEASKGSVHVLAIEPDPQMLAELRRQVPGVTALTGRAEEIPLP
ncbi:MAG TPA: hypothetical protein VF834_09640, partial [Streptosporangiaceae bacterium]